MGWLHGRPPPAVSHAFLNRRRRLVIQVPDRRRRAVKTDIHSDYHEITVVMTDSTGFKTRTARDNAGDTLKLDIDPDPSRLDGRAPPGGKRRAVGEVRQTV